MSMQLTQRRTTPRMSPKPKFGSAQAEFISKLHRDVEAKGQSFFNGKDWTNLAPVGGRNTCLNNADLQMYAESFYVRPVALWIPHLLLPNHLPTCPHCEKNDGITLAPKLDWVDSPKVLYGLRGHKYLDTIYYRCCTCSRKFTGYNEMSLKLDSHKILGVFNYYVSKGLAVDDELYSHIVNHSNDTTASIYKNLAQGLADDYIDSAMFYYKAVAAQKIVVQPKKFVAGTTQRTIDSMITFTKGPLSLAEKRRRTLKDDLARAKRDLYSAECRLKEDVNFADVFKRKANRNNLGLPFKGIGKQKLLAMIGAGISSAKEMIAYNGDDPDVLPQWKEVMISYYADIEEQVVEYRARVERLSEEADLQDLADVLNSGEDMDLHAIDNHPANTGGPDPDKVPAFSTICDPTKWNVQCISKGVIDRITSTNAMNRKSVQVSKMQNIPATVLKFDFSYKLAPKIKVYTGRGDSFSPYKCSVNVHQENGLCVFWKCYPTSESFGPNGMQPDLYRMKDRFDILGCTIKLCYVDNCCSIRDSLTGIFPETLVKLDCFHWLKRWDVIIFDTKSAEAAVFRHLMRKSVFFTENGEIERAKESLRRKFGGVRQPTIQEVMKEAKAIIPPPEGLKSRVEAVLRYVLHNDWLLEMEGADLGLSTATTEGVKRKPFFISKTALVSKTIRNQMTHVILGCLSDPPKEYFRMHRVNPYTDKAFSVRSTGTNEADNRQLNRLLDAPSVGIARAERVIFDHYEVSNENKAVKRLGQAVPITSRSERLYFINSVAKSAGFSDDELPVKVSYPPTIPVQEFMGLNYQIPDAYQAVISAEDTPAENGDESNRDFFDFLAGVDFEDEDVPVDATQFATVDPNFNVVDPSAGTLEEILADPNVNTEPLPLDKSIEREVAKHLPSIHLRETTMQTFTRLTQGTPWVPFKDPKAERSDVDVAEYDLFERLRGNYDRFGGNLNGPRGYHRFAAQWDIEVAKCFNARMEAIANGVTPPPMIRRKTYLQLQQHYDQLLTHIQTALLVTPNDPNRREMEDMLRQTRRRLPPTQEAHVTSPLQYNHAQFGPAPFGAPTALNTPIAATAMQYSEQKDSSAPFVVRPIASPTIVDMPLLNPRGGNFKDRKYCIKCGYSKSEHLTMGTPFGNLCSNNCGREECSKCQLRMEFHDIGKIGPYCLGTVSATSEFFDWYKERPGTVPRMEANDKENSTNTGII